MRVSTRAEELGGHTHVGIWIDGGKTGLLVMTNEEWPQFERALREGLAKTGHIYQTAEQAAEHVQFGRRC